MRQFLVMIFVVFISPNVMAENVSTYCSEVRCTEPISNLRLGLFSFEANTCQHKIKCYSLNFGVPGKFIKLTEMFDYESTYRILNGPLPLNLECVDGITYGFQDSPDFSNMDGFYGIEWFGDRDYQRREKIYYKNNSDQTFSFFSEQPTTIGVLVSTHSATGLSSSTTYLFDTVTGETTHLKGDCRGPFG